jgi:hypothetical protein
MSSFDNFNSNGQKWHHTPTNSMIHKFLDILEIMNYENTIYSITLNQNFYPLGLFKNTHSKEQNFPMLFYGQPQQIFEGFSYQQIAQ